MRKLVNWLKDEESGQGMVEYALILALIAVVCIIAFTFLGQSAANKANQVAKNLV